MDIVKYLSSKEIEEMIHVLERYLNNPNPIVRSVAKKNIEKFKNELTLRKTKSLRRWCECC